jgi:hypothetical protein
MDLPNRPIGPSAAGRIGPPAASQLAAAAPTDVDSLIDLASHAAVDDSAEKAADQRALENRTDARNLAVKTGLRGPDGPGGRKTVNFSAVFSSEIQKVLPGARLAGEWSVEQMTALKGVIADLPEAFASRLQGLEFVLEDAGESFFDRTTEVQRRDDKTNQTQVASVVRALRREDRRAVMLSHQAFDLPDMLGVPGFKIALLRELGMLMSEKSQKLQEFGKLSGWKQTLRSANGEVLEALKDATGFAPGELPAGSRRERADTSARPVAVGTQRLNPLETGRLSTEALPGTRPGDARPPARPAGRSGPIVPPAAFDSAARPIPGGNNRPAAPRTAPPRSVGTASLQAGLTPEGAGPGSPGMSPLEAGVLGFAARRELAAGATTSPGSTAGRLADGQSGKSLELAVVSARGQEAIEGGSRVEYSDNSTLTYAHAPDAHFGKSGEPPGDPRQDFAESFQAFMLTPKTLLQAAPEKFLLLNADSGSFSGAEVQAMAKASGVDLTQVVTSLVVGGRASQALVDRISRYHGISADKVALLAKDQELLGKGANLAALVERLALDIGANGTATTKLLNIGESLGAQHHALAGRLSLAREGGGLAAGSRVVSWLVAKAGDALGGDRLAKLDARLADVRAQFTQLPLAVQLRTDPRLALGANWFTLSAQERGILSNPTALQQLIAKASDRAEDAAYIPQNLTAKEKARLADRAIFDALFDPSSQGAAFRSKLAGVNDLTQPNKSGIANPEAALKALRAKNGESVWGLLSDAQKRYFLDPRNVASLQQALQGQEFIAARGVLRDGTTGAEQLKATLLRLQLGDFSFTGDQKQPLDAVLAAITATRQKLFEQLGGSPLELALTEINRQVQEGNMPFVQRLLGLKGEQALAGALGPWVTAALSSAERKLLEDGDYRRHLVQNAEQISSTGMSLTEEARQYRVQTEHIQQALDFLLRPDNEFRREFELDPVAALKKRGLWVQLPDAIQASLADGQRQVKLSKLVVAVQEALSPIILRQLGYAKKLENLQKAVKGVNAGNYSRLLGLLDLGVPELQRTVRGGLAEAMAGEAEHKAGGSLSFV